MKRDINDVSFISCLSDDNKFICSISTKDGPIKFYTKKIIIERKSFQPKDIKQLQREYNQLVKCSITDSYIEMIDGEETSVFGVFRCNSGKKVRKLSSSQTKSIQESEHRSNCPDYPYPCQCKRNRHNPI